MKKRIDIIIPIFNEENNIVRLYEEILKQTNDLNDYEFWYVFINDGSLDHSMEVLKHLAEKDKSVKVINLSRNFGKEIALTAGLDCTQADAAIFIDADLQHPPHLIPALIKKWESGIEVVTTVRKNIKKQPIMRRVGSYFFYWILNKLSDVKMTPKTTDFRMIDKSVINILKRFTERNRMFRGLIDWIGPKTGYVEFIAPERNTGKARYSFKKLVNLALNSITSFSLLPLKVAGYIGLFISIVSVILFLVMLIVSFVLRSPFFSSLSFVIVCNTILIGIVLICLGFIALYIGQIHSEVINRPLYVIREKINFE
jgi:dolichol-phosphate mannosyltransferase